MTYNMVMKQVTLADAKARLSAILDRVEKGETIAITRRHRVIAHVGPVPKGRSAPRPWGLCRGAFHVPDGFDAPLPDDLLADFEGR